MKAMILAAGLGTRLRPLTDLRPKALVELNGLTLLEITIARLREIGVRDIIVNVHHFADMMLEYLRQKNNFGINIAVSREKDLLDTGGGLKKATYFFQGETGPFFIHNVDVISSIDLQRMLSVHKESGSLATLAVQKRESSRQLLFDQTNSLCGREIKEKTQVARTAPNLQRLAFAGIHVVSPRLLDMMTEEGAFSIIDTYLRLTAQGERISGFRADEYYWRDLGRLQDLDRAAADLRKNALQA